jgi:CheY-like chemotaxis protein
MTLATGGDVLGFYSALEVDLPTWGDRRYAPTRCFAAPEEHTNGDRTPSLSVNLSNGRYKCWGCGARGGPYDAALACGHSPRSAMELLVAHGLAEPRNGDRCPRAHRAPAPRRRQAVPIAAPPARPQLKIGEEDVGEPDVQGWIAALAERPALIERVCRARGWRYPAMRELEVGLEVRIDGDRTRLGRLTIPIRDAGGELRGVLRYRLPWRSFGAKMVTASGTRLGLVPHPGRECAAHVLLVEGPPDAIAARSRGLPALAVPGTDAWQPKWAELLRGRTVSIVMDADRVGRAAAARIQADLEPLADVAVIDLAPEREDGYDLTDALRSEREIPRALAHIPASDAAPLLGGLGALA